MDELTALRTSVIYVLIVLVGGIVGLMLTADSLFKIALIVVGVYCAAVVVLNMISINSQIDKVLNLKKED